MTISTDSARWYRGPAQITFDGNNLGDSVNGSGVEVTITSNHSASLADKFGQTPVRMHDLGDNIEAVAYLLERDFEVLKTLLPAGTWSGTNKEMTVTAGVTDLTGYAKELVITPLDSNYSGDTLTIFSAIAEFDGSMMYNSDEQQVFQVKFVGLVGTSDELYKIGVNNS